GGGIEDDADGGAWDLVFATNVADDFGFHFDSTGVSGFPKLAFFGGGGGDPVGAVEAAGEGARGDEAKLEASVVTAEKDGAEGEVRVEGASEAAREDEGGLVSGECGANRSLSITLAHSGQEDLDVGI